MCKQEIASQAKLFSPSSCSLLGAQVALAEPEANFARKISGMSDIRRAREIVGSVAAQLGNYGFATLAEDLGKAVRLMYRRPLAKPRAPVTSAHIGPEEAAAIRALAKRRPELSEQEIAEMFSTNAGRVSEALHRDR